MTRIVAVAAGGASGRGTDIRTGRLVAERDRPGVLPVYCSEANSPSVAGRTVRRPDPA